MATPETPSATCRRAGRRPDPASWRGSPRGTARSPAVRPQRERRHRTVCPTPWSPPPRPARTRTPPAARRRRRPVRAARSTAMTATDTAAPSTPPDGLPDPLRACGLVPSTCPAWRSFTTSPASPHATATTPATKNSCTCGTSAAAATARSTMSPKISMGSMPVCPTLCALMAVATQASSTTTTAGTGPSPSPKHSASATARHGEAPPRRRAARRGACRPPRRGRGRLASAPARKASSSARAAPSDRRARAALGRRALRTSLAALPRPAPLLEGDLADHAHARRPS